MGNLEADLKAEDVLKEIQGNQVAESQKTVLKEPRENQVVKALLTEEKNKERKENFSSFGEDVPDFLR